jgi:hypothetical protein
MRRLVLLVLSFAGLAAANPIMITFLSEFSADTTGGQWLELHVLPGGGSQDLTGWRITTSTSACTLSCLLDDYTVIDSVNLALGMDGTGKFRLNPDRDSIRLIDTTGRIQQAVRYPCESTGIDCSLCPPQGGSASFWNVDFFDGGQAFNWYIDSTPTPGEANNDFSTISGAVLLDSTPAGADVVVTPHGRLAGTCFSDEYMETSYSVQGLGPGWYQVEAVVCSPYRTLRGVYPESVFVGYSQNLTGINIDLRGQGVAEHARPAPPARPGLRVRGAELEVLCPTAADVRLKVYDLTGACRAVLHEGLLESGVHRFDLASRVSPGVYFARLTTGDRTCAAKLVVPR